MMARYLTKLTVWIIITINNRLEWFIQRWGNIVNANGNLHSNIVVGRHTYGINRKTISLALSSNSPCVEIGSFCSVAPGVVMLANTEHPTNLPSTFPFKTIFSQRTKNKSYPRYFNFDAASRGPIKIGHDVWIGQNVIILSGVSIGTGAIVGAGSLVAKNIPPYAVAVGNPAKVIRFRFSPEVVLRLLSSEWWTLSDECLIELEEYLYDTDINKFLDRVVLCKKNC
jgi:acetyltransferase-like isoleucine patch superfamily enzyme